MDRLVRLGEESVVGTVFGRVLRMAAMAGIVHAGLAAGEDWPRWRGPRGDGTWQAPPLSERWPSAGLKAAWRVPIGGGYAGVVVADGLVYTMDRPKPSQKGADPDGTERVLCVDAKTGKQLWSHEYPAHYGDLDHGNGPRAAPTVFDGRVYSLGAVGAVRCLDARSGAILWQKELGPQRKGRVSDWWGYSASPLVVNDLVIVHAGAEPAGCVIAYDRRTGAEAWRSLPDPAGYATPILIDAPSGRQLVLWTPENVYGLDPKTGTVHWNVPYKVTYGVSIATPIYHQGIVFVSGYWEGSKAIALGTQPDDATLVWEENRNLRGLMAPPLYRDGYVYTLDKQFGLTCFELKTGRKQWDDGNRMTPKGRNPQATFVWTGDDDRVLALNSEGELILARFSPKGYEELTRAKVIGPTWANPAFADRHLYARNDKELVCIPLPTRGSD